MTFEEQSIYFATRTAWHCQRRGRAVTSDFIADVADAYHATLGGPVEETDRAIRLAITRNLLPAN